MVDGWKAGEGSCSAVEMVARIHAYRAAFGARYGKPIPPETVEQAIRLHGHRGLGALHVAAEWTLARAPGSALRSSARPSRRRTVRRRQTARTPRGSPVPLPGDDDEPHDVAASTEAVVARHRAVAEFSGMAPIADLVMEKLDVARARAEEQAA
jgi:hypothetical protein